MRILISRIMAAWLAALILAVGGAGAAPGKGNSPAKSAAGAKAAPERSDGWPDTPEGALGRRWVAAFVTGEAAMRRFYAEDLADAAKAERSVETRIQRYRDLREKFGRLTFGSVTRQAPGELTVTLLDADAAIHTFVFKAQREAPFRMLSVSMLQRQHGAGFHH